MKLDFYRKNFVIFALVLLLGLIGYVNYQLNNQALLQTSNELENYEMTMLRENGMLTDILDEDELVLSDEVSETAGGDNMEGEEEAQVSENELDNTIVVDSRDNILSDLVQETNSKITEVISSKDSMKKSTFFIETRLERDKKRSEMISSLNEIINNNNTGQEIKDQAQAMKLNLISSTEKEMTIESMIMAKGFNDVVVYLTDQSINIVVQSDELDAVGVAKIVDIVKRETDIPMDNIIIMNKK